MATGYASKSLLNRWRAQWQLRKIETEQEAI
jgi:hypothetical protein